MIPQPWASPILSLHLWSTSCYILEKECLMTSVLPYQFPRWPWESHLTFACLHFPWNGDEWSSRLSHPAVTTSIKPGPMRTESRNFSNLSLKTSHYCLLEQCRPVVDRHKHFCKGKKSPVASHTSNCKLLHSSSAFDIPRTTSLLHIHPPHATKPP